MCSAPGARLAAIRFAEGIERPQGAENSALKNTAPFSFTPLRTWEIASILYSGRPAGRSAKFPGRRAKQSAPASRSSKSWRRSGMVSSADALHNCSSEEDFSRRFGDGRVRKKELI